MGVQFRGKFPPYAAVINFPKSGSLVGDIPSRVGPMWENNKTSAKWVVIC